MAALLLVLLITLVASHWLLEPWFQPLQWLLELRALPWLALGLGAWLLAGPQRD